MSDPGDTSVLKSVEVTHKYRCADTRQQRVLPASRPVDTSGELHHMLHGCLLWCLENLLTRYLDRSASAATEASESRNVTATCPTLKLIHMSGSGKSSCSADSYKCLYISVTFFMDFFRLVSAPPGGTAVSGIRKSSPDRMFTGWSPLSLTYPPSSPPPTSSYLWGSAS